MRLPKENPSYAGKLYWELTDDEREEFRRDGEALKELLDEILGPEEPKP